MVKVYLKRGMSNGSKCVEVYNDKEGTDFKSVFNSFCPKLAIKNINYDND